MNSKQKALKYLNSMPCYRYKGVRIYHIDIIKNALDIAIKTTKENLTKHKSSSKRDCCIVGEHNWGFPNRDSKQEVCSKCLKIRNPS